MSKQTKQILSQKNLLTAIRVLCTIGDNFLILLFLCEFAKFVTKQQNVKKKDTNLRASDSPLVVVSDVLHTSSVTLKEVIYTFSAGSTIVFVIRYFLQL